MSASARQNRYLGYFFSLLGVLLVLYFGSYALYGSRGVLALARVNQDIEDARGLLNERLEEKAALESRVSHLSPAHLDQDLLDERARRMLNRVRPDERIILLTPSGSPDQLP